jgi:hypothetical protein
MDIWYLVFVMILLESVKSRSPDDMREMY